MELIRLVVVALALSHISASENNTFVATDQWQEIVEGQSIPAGLHVRINLQTGKKEAKLLNESDESGQGQRQLEGHGRALASVTNIEESPPDRISSTKQKLLLEAKEPVPKEVEKTTDWSEKVKSLKELKKSYEDIRKHFKTDAEVITELLGEFRNRSKAYQEPLATVAREIPTVLRILENFGYLLHQYDNALLFIDQGGLEDLILPIVVNQTTVSLRAQALRVLGTLTQNNPKAQIKVFELNFGAYLSQILISSTQREVLSTAIFAFGSLLRKFPLAQQRIFSTNGIQALTAVLSKECDLKIKAKAATVISDVIAEKRLVLSLPVAEQDAVAVAQYNELDFPKWLNLNAYCDTMDSLITTKLYELLEEPNLMEYFTHALDNTRAYCMTLWSQSPQLRHTLITLKSRYVQSKEDYRLEVAKQIDEVFSALYQTGMPHYEL